MVIIHLREEKHVHQSSHICRNGGNYIVDGCYCGIGKAQVGEKTSAMKSPILGNVIALARIDATHTIPGTDFEVGQLNGQQKRLAATVVGFPHIDPTRERVKDNYG